MGIFNTGKYKGKWKRCLALIAVTTMLGGCAMGGPTGSKTLKGQKALQAGEYQEAKRLFEEAVVNNEQPVIAYRGLGMAYMSLAEYDKAAQAFQTALDNADGRMEENTLDLQLYLATVQYRGASYEDTIVTCDTILDEDEVKNADAYFLRGASYLHEGQLEKAEADFQAAVQITPADYDLYLNIYECYNSQNLSGLGAEYLQSALNIQGDDVEHSYNRGRVYFYLQQYDKAQSELIGPVDEQYQPAMYLIGRVYLAQNDYEHAQAIYNRLQDIDGVNANTCNGLALCALQSGNYDEALTYIAKGLEQGDNAENQELYFNEIIAYEKKLDFPAARIKAQEYVQRYPGDAAGQKEWTFLSTR